MNSSNQKKAFAKTFCNISYDKYCKKCAQIKLSTNLPCLPDVPWTIQTGTVHGHENGSGDNDAITEETPPQNLTRAQNLQSTSDRYSCAQNRDVDGVMTASPKRPAPTGVQQQFERRLLREMHPKWDDQNSDQVEDRGCLSSKEIADAGGSTISTPATGSATTNEKATGGSAANASTQMNVCASGEEARQSPARTFAGVLCSQTVAANQATGGSADHQLDPPELPNSTSDLSRNRKTSSFKLAQSSRGIRSVSWALGLGGSDFALSTTESRGGSRKCQHDTRDESKVLTAHTSSRKRREGFHPSGSSAETERAAEINATREDVHQPTSATVVSSRDGCSGRFTSNSLAAMCNTTIEFDSTTTRDLTRQLDCSARTPTQGQSVPAADEDLSTPVAPPRAPTSNFGPRRSRSSLQFQRPPHHSNSNQTLYAKAIGNTISRTLLPLWELQPPSLSITQMLSPPRHTSYSPTSSPKAHRTHEQQLSGPQPGRSESVSSGSTVPVSHNRKWHAGSGAPPVPQLSSTGANRAPEISRVPASAESSSTLSITSATRGATKVVSAMHPDARTSGSALSYWQCDVTDCVSPADYECSEVGAGIGPREGGSNAGTTWSKAGKSVWCGLHRKGGAVLRRETLCCSPGCGARWTWGYARDSVVSCEGQSAARSCTEHKHHA